jgi:NADPH:quinone reductase-like Zn-dependent oxidoreductase
MSFNEERTMQAAVVNSTDRPPTYTAFPDPEVGPGEAEGTVLASAVHQVVRAVAAGRHYGPGTAPPFVPGVDGVVRLPDGRRVYTGGARPPWGMLAERVATHSGFAVEVPATLDDAVAAAIVNPAASSWIPLRRLLPAGGTVLVVGATGISGLLAVQAAQALGAGRVVALGRNSVALDRARELGADVSIALNQDLGPALASAADGYDVVLDYLWGEPAVRTLTALADRGIDPTRPVRVVNIGSLAGSEIAVPASLLRSAALTLSGHGFGSSPTNDLPSSVAEIFTAAVAGQLHVNVVTRPLSEVESAWDTAERLVLVP